jgi:hypothetical protein
MTSKTDLAAECEKYAEWITVPLAACDVLKRAAAALRAHETTHRKAFNARGDYIRELLEALSQLWRDVLAGGGYRASTKEKVLKALKVQPEGPNALPEALRDPIKCMARGRELLASWGPTPVTDAALAETTESRAMLYELLASACAELPDPDFVPEEDREIRLRSLRERIDAYLSVTDYMKLRSAVKTTPTGEELLELLSALPDFVLDFDGHVPGDHALRLAERAGLPRNNEAWEAVNKRAGLSSPEEPTAS